QGQHIKTGIAGRNRQRLSLGSVLHRGDLETAAGEENCDDCGLPIAGKLLKRKNKVRDGEGAIANTRGRMCSPEGMRLTPRFNSNPADGRLPEPLEAICWRCAGKDSPARSLDRSVLPQTKASR